MGNARYTVPKPHFLVILVLPRTHERSSVSSQLVGCFFYSYHLWLMNLLSKAGQVLCEFWFWWGYIWQLFFISSRIWATYGAYQEWGGVKLKSRWEKYHLTLLHIEGNCKFGDASITCVHQHWHYPVYTRHCGGCKNTSIGTRRIDSTCITRSGQSDKVGGWDDVLYPARLFNGRECMM